MIIVIGSIVAKADKKAEVLSLSLDHVRRSQTEPGCLRHTVSQDCENPQRFVFVESWVDMAALQVHFGLETSQNFVRDLTPLLSAKPEMKIYNATEIPSG